jgi:hypothetical protein
MLKLLARAVTARHAEVQTHEITLRTHRQGPRAAEMQQIRRRDKSAFNHVAVAPIRVAMARANGKGGARASRGHGQRVSGIGRDFPASGETCALLPARQSGAVRI